MHKPLALLTGLALYSNSMADGLQEYFDSGQFNSAPEMVLTVSNPRWINDSDLGWCVNLTPLYLEERYKYQLPDPKPIIGECITPEPLAPREPERSWLGTSSLDSSLFQKPLYLVHHFFCYEN